MTDIEHQQPVPRDWWSPFLITVIVIFGYVVGPTRLPLHGEETRRAQFGREMADNGDWVIATVQATPKPTRPPLQYWLLAGIHRWVHELDTLTLRLLMAVVTLSTSLLTWWYARQFLSSVGAFLAGVAYPTMGHVFELGRRVETDGLFTLLLTSSLLVWHVGYLNRWRYVAMWTSAAFLAALAALTKGTQAPVAFFGTVYLFLLCRRDWRCLFHWSHFAGLATFLGTIALWQIPFYLRAGLAATRVVWLGEISMRVGFDATEFLLHLVQFPFEVFAASLPWSALLLGMLHPAFWRMENHRMRSAMLFTVIAMASIFGPVWVSRGGIPRYVMPMYPLLAIACGAVATRALSVEKISLLRLHWRNFVLGSAVVMAIMAGVFVSASLAAAFGDWQWAERLNQPWWLNIIMGTGGLAAVALVLRQSGSEAPRHVMSIALTLAALLTVLFNGAVVNAHAERTVNLAPEIAMLRARLPNDADLVSFGRLHHRFVFFYEQPIPLLPWPKTADEVPPHVEYFAVEVFRGYDVKLPFAWEPVAEINMDRTYDDEAPQVTTMVARRIRIP